MGKTSKPACRLIHFGYLPGSYSSTLDVPFYQCGHRVATRKPKCRAASRSVCWRSLLGVPALSPTVRACQAQPSFLEHRFSLVRRSREWHLGSPADAIPPYGRVLVWVSFCFCFPLSRTVCCPHAAEVKEEPSRWSGHRLRMGRLQWNYRNMETSFHRPAAKPTPPSRGFEGSAPQFRPTAAFTALASTTGPRAATPGAALREIARDGNRFHRTAALRCEMKGCRDRAQPPCQVRVSLSGCCSSVAFAA